MKRLFLGMVFLSVTALAFDAPSELKVYTGGADGCPSKILGFTPSPHRDIPVPRWNFWYVRPVGPLTAERWDSLIQTLRTSHVPGVDLSNRWDVTDTEAERFTDLPHLRMVSFVQTRMGDTAMEAFGRLPSLTVLSVNRRVTDAGLAALKDAHKLRELDLTDTSVTDAGLAILTSLRVLQRLRLAGTRIDDDGMSVSVTSMTALREIDLRRTAVTDAGIVALEALPHLEVAYLNEKVSDEGLHRVGHLRSLRRLDLTGARVTNAGVASLSDLKNLKELGLGSTRVGPGGLKGLQTLSSLEIVDLGATSITPEDLKDLVPLRHLKVLSLPWEQLSHDQTRTLAQCPSLQTLILDGHALPEETFAHLKAIAPAATPMVGEASLPLSAPERVSGHALAERRVALATLHSRSPNRILPGLVNIDALLTAEEFSVSDDRERSAPIDALSSNAPQKELPNIDVSVPGRR